MIHFSPDIIIIFLFNELETRLHRLENRSLVVTVTFVCATPCGGLRSPPGLFLCGRRRRYQTRSRHVANTHLLRESSRRVPAACFVHYTPYLPRDAGGQMRKWTRPLFPFFVEKEEEGEVVLGTLA